jgi:beta-galactosidase
MAVIIRRRAAAAAAAAAAATLLLVASAARPPPAPPASPRTRTSFDADFKFFLGNPTPASSCNASAFAPLVGVQCLGLDQQGGVASAAACQAACCAAGGTGCLLWQYSGGASGAGCWTGSDCSDNLTNPNWVGASRPPPNPTQTCDPASPCARSYDDSAWRTLTVPHDFIIEGTFDPALDPSHGALPRNTSWYRKTFSLPASAADGLVYLTFDGVFRAADIYINGAFVMHHEEGYTSFHAYLHNASVPLDFGPGSANVLAVYVDATQLELWCAEGGGIFRHVWLETASNLSFVPWSLYAPSFVTGAITGGDATAAQTADGAVLLPQVDVANAGAARAVGSVTFTLLGPSNPDGSAGPVVTTVQVPFNVSAGGFQRVTSPSAVPFGSGASPVALWNTAPSPPTYIVTAALTPEGGGGGPSDGVAARVGVRSAVFDPRLGFVLNGVKVPIQGVSMHISFGGVGMALPDRVAEFQVAALRRMGANGWRTAHNPVAPELLDYADEYGMLVWEENRFVTSGVQPLASPQRGGPKSVEEAAGAAGAAGAASGDPPSPPSIPAADPRLLQDAQDMVLRDRNHPSVVIWSLCNELGCVADSPTGNTLASQFKASIYAADQSRPVTGNTVQSPYLDNKLVDGFAQAMDVQSFSYEYNAYTEFHYAAPYKAVGGGESASCVVDRGYYGPTNGTSGHVGPSHGVFACAVASWTPAATLPWIYGSFAWTGIDYYGEVYPLGWPDTSSHFGIHDLAGFPKDHAGYYRAWWRDGAACAAGDGKSTSISISPSDWTAPVPVGSTLDVVVMTCGASVDLFVNGQRVGPATPTPVPAYGLATFPGVVFAPGNVTAVVYDAGGAVLGTQTVVSAGSAYALHLWVEDGFLNSTSGVLAANGNDAALIGVSLLDANGVLVPNADVNVTFTVSGPARILGTANGDPSDHSPPTYVPYRLTFHGLARLIIASSAAGATGSITVSAAAPGLQPASVQLEAM